MWIKHIPYSEAGSHLKALYERVKGPHDKIDNIMLAHSLRPHTMAAHMALYKNVLHHAANVTPEWFLETLGVQVSLLNGCAYCVEHHFAGLRRLLGNNARAATIRRALESEEFGGVFSPAEQTALHYARTLTCSPQSRDALQEQIEAMRAAGYGDGRILEINQVVSYFSYANRTVLGLGVTTQGDVLGLSPGNTENPDDWSHH